MGRSSPGHYHSRTPSSIVYTRVPDRWTALYKKAAPYSAFGISEQEGSSTGETFRMARRQSPSGWLVLLLSVTIVDRGSPLSVPGYEYEAYAMRGDVNIGMITYIHRFSSESFCSEKAWRSEPLRSEVASYMTTVINDDDGILPNITLGFVVLDGCTKDLTALAAALYLVEPPDRPRRRHPERRPSVVAVLGPTTSRQAVLASSFLGLFRVPTLSPSATSDELSDKQRYAYFMRLVPPDKHQAEAIADLVDHLRWSYVSLLYSEGSYGENGAKNIERLVKSRRFCLATSKRIPADASQSEMNAVVRRMADENKLAPAVIILLEADDLYKLFYAVRQANLTDHFRWIASDSFWTIKDSGVEDVAIGTLYIDFPSGDDSKFREYVKGISWLNSTNPWVSLFFEGAFNCSWSVGANETRHDSCRSHKTLGEASKLSVPAVGKLIDGFMVYAKALHQLIGEHCPSLFRNDIDRDFSSCIDGDLLLRYMRNVSFEGHSEPITFDDKGDMNGRYLIKQLRAGTTDDRLASAVIGEWKRAEPTLVFDHRAIDDWNDSKNVFGHAVVSVCSSDCEPGHYYQQTELPCCWHCIECREDEITTNHQTACLPCPKYQWPDADSRSVCRPIEPSYLSIETGVGLLVVVTGLVGVSCAVGLMVVYRMKSNNRLLKATSLELSVLIFVGSMLACVVSTSYVSYPRHVVCVLRHVGFHLAVTIIYAPLLSKTSRVYRIFRAGKKGQSRPRFISTKTQLIFTCFVILIQVGVLISLEIVSPTVSELRMPRPFERYVEATCSFSKTTFLVPLTINMSLIALCVVMAFLTRKLPQNYNESHYVFVSTSTTLFVWSVFLPTHFTVGQSEHRSLLLAFSLQINAYVIMLVQYGPKVYAAFWLNEQRLNVNMASISTNNRIAQMPNT